MKYIILLLAIVFVTNAHAQTDTVYIEPGSKIIDASFVENYTNKWKVTFITKNGKEIPNRIWTDYGQLIDLNGKTYLHRVQDLYSAEYQLQDTWVNMVEVSSMKPWQFYTANPSGGFSFYQFSDDMLVTKSNLNDDAKIISDSLRIDQPIFDWNLYGMMLVGLPFENGKVYKMPFYNPLQKEVAHLLVTIMRQEIVTNLNGGSFKAWKLSTNQNLNFWLTKEAPYVIQLELIMPDQGKLFWNSY